MPTVFQVKIHEILGSDNSNSFKHELSRAAKFLLHSKVELEVNEVNYYSEYDLKNENKKLIDEMHQLKLLLREFMMRSKCAFPENDADVFWWNSGLKPDLMTRFFDAAGISQQEIPGFPVHAK